MHACLMLGRLLSHSSSRYISLNCIPCMMLAVLHLWVITDLIPWGRLGPAHAPPGIGSMCSIEGQRGSTCVAWVLDTKSTNVLPHHPPCWSSTANHNSKLFSSNYFLHPYGTMFQAGWIRSQYLAPNRGRANEGIAFLFSLATP